MSDPVEYLCLIVSVAILATFLITRRVCADASYRGEWAWWRREMFKAKQRSELKKYDKEQRQMERIERMAERKETA